MAKELVEMISEQPKTGAFNSAKNAFSSIWNYARNMFLITAGVFAIGAGAAGCKLEPEPIPSQPKATLSVSPNSGQAPLSTRIKVGGEGDLYGAFADYNNNEKEDSGEEIIPPQSTPIDIPYTFTKSGTFDVHGWASLAGQTDEASEAISVSQPTVIPPVEPPVDNDYQDISINVESNETHLPLRAIARAYNARDPNVIAALNSTDSDSFAAYFAAAPILKEFPTDASGNATATLSELVSQLPGGVVLRVRATDSDWNSGNSYIRTIKGLPAGDVTSSTDSRMNPAVRVVPYPDLVKEENFSTSDFKQHMKEVNFYYGVGHLMKYYITNIGILDVNPLSPEHTFSDETNIKNHITNLYETIGKTIPITSNPSEGVAYTRSGNTIIPENGWVIIIPDTLAMGIGGDVQPNGSGQPFSFGSALMVLNDCNQNYNNPLNGVIDHESLHSLAFPGHAKTLATSGSDGKYYSNEKTIMPEIINTSNSGSGDKKAAKIVYEDTYKAGENLDDILGVDFY
jgi:hypothetical protein